MKAIVINSFGGPEKLVLKEIEKPRPLPHEVLIKVAYASVNPVDWKIREGLLQQRLPHQFPLILGWDVSGTIEEVGKKVSDFQPGDEIFAYIRKPIVQWGSYAEYVTFDAEHVAKKPKNCTFAQAAALPLVSLTAWQSLIHAVALRHTNTVLIQGASGGVGAMGVQFAKWKGAIVFGTASKAKHDYVTKLGADYVFDYHDQFIDQLKMYSHGGVDIFFDCVGGEAFRQGIACIKPGSRVVSILEHIDPNEAAQLRVEQEYVFVEPNGSDLRTIATLIEQKKIFPLPIEEMDLSDASQAQEKLKSGKIFGKLVLKVS